MHSAAFIWDLTDREHEGEKKKKTEANLAVGEGVCRFQMTRILKTNFSEADDLLWDAAQLCQMAIPVQAAEEFYSNGHRSRAGEASPLTAHQAKLLYNLIWF